VPIVLQLKIRNWGTLLVCGVLAVVGLSASAVDKKEDKDKPALAGAWAKKDAELKIEFADKGTLKIVPHGDEEMIVFLCSYTVEKGTVKVKITSYEGKQEIKEKLGEKLPVGTEFTFKWQINGDSATLDDVKGDKAEVFKTHLEGTFEKKK
jgi:hypothetical protein